MSFCYLNTTFTVHRIRQPVRLSHVDRLKDEVPNDFFFAAEVLQCCAGLWPLCANKSRERRDYKYFDDNLNLSFKLRAKSQARVRKYRTIKWMILSQWLSWRFFCAWDTFAGTSHCRGVNHLCSWIHSCTCIAIIHTFFHTINTKFHTYALLFKQEPRMWYSIP